MCVKNLRYAFLIESVKKQMRCLSLILSAGTGVEFTQTYVFEKNVSIKLLRFGYFKEMSHNLKLLSFQKMCGVCLCAGTGVEFTQTYVEKNVSIKLLRFGYFKEMSHNLKLLSFQKMCGL